MISNSTFESYYRRISSCDRQNKITIVIKFKSVNCYRVAIKDDDEFGKELIISDERELGFLSRRHP